MRTNTEHIQLERLTKSAPINKVVDFELAAFYVRQLQNYAENRIGSPVVRQPLYQEAARLYKVNPTHLAVFMKVNNL